eukprot:COSAG03_NODE_15_length_22165_cov_72.809934_9_plen_77_part_00
MATAARSTRRLRTLAAQVAAPVGFCGILTHAADALPDSDCLSNRPRIARLPVLSWTPSQARTRVATPFNRALRAFS